MWQEPEWVKDSTIMGAEATTRAAAFVSTLVAGSRRYLPPCRGGWSPGAAQPYAGSTTAAIARPEPTVFDSELDAAGTGVIVGVAALVIVVAGVAAVPSLVAWGALG